MHETKHLRNWVVKTIQTDPSSRLICALLRNLAAGKSSPHTRMPFPKPQRRLPALLEGFCQPQFQVVHLT